MAPASSKEFFDIQANYRVWIHSETRAWHDNNIQKSTMILLTQGAQFGRYDKKVRFQTIYTHPLDACLALRLLLFLKERIGNK